MMMMMMLEALTHSLEGPQSGGSQVGARCGDRGWATMHWMIWTNRHYDSVEPGILSVVEEDEVSIRLVASSMARAMDFCGRVE